MCQERNKGNVKLWDKEIKIDRCMKPLIKWLNNKHITVACCCGHDRYPATIVVKEGIIGALKNRIIYREIFSQIIIPRTRRFYVKDKKGFYYIPETIQKDSNKVI